VPLAIRASRVLYVGLFGGQAGLPDVGGLPTALFYGVCSFLILMVPTAMMGATLQAPLAALTAILELTANPNIILPGMLALITAGLVSREVFGMDSVYQVLLRARGLDYHHNPLTQALHRIGVAGVMERRVATLPEGANRQEATAALASEPQWILVNINRHPAWIMPAADLARHLAKHEPEELLPLGDIPAQRREITAIDFTATLMEAQEALERDKADAAYVVRRTIPGIERVYGILTREDIERSYRIE